MMIKMIRNTVVALGFMSCLGAGSGASAQVYGQFKDPLPMIQRSVLNDPQDPTGVPDGRMGGIAYDPFSQCMYFTAPRSGVLIVEDPPAMSRLQVLRDLNEPMSVAVAADLRKLVLTCGDGSVRVYKIEAAGADAKAEPAGRLTFEKSVSNPGEADQVRYDSKTKRAFYGHGKYLSWVTPADGAKCPKSIELPGPTKGMVIEPGSDRMFVSISSKAQILVIDRVKWEIIATWQLKDADQPCPLALDDMGGKLFVACRNPAKLLILDAKDGKEIERLNIGSDAADCWWDPIGRRVYVSCGQPGQVSMIRDQAGKYSVEHEVDTMAGARTSIFVPEKRRLIVCAPKSPDMPTFVYIYVLPNVMEHNEPVPKSH